MEGKHPHHEGLRAEGDSACPVEAAGCQVCWGLLEHPKALCANRRRIKGFGLAVL